TLGRDVKLLAQKGYRLTRATAVDLFPGTAHVETEKPTENFAEYILRPPGGAAWGEVYFYQGMRPSGS
ncbi:MAG: hypothetical protein KH544_08780, partial [Firmicutes bacterium]|nr:hypothetical protein [Bacillota bacterium]